MPLPILADAPVEPSASRHQMPGTSAPHDLERVEVQKNLSGVRRKIGIHSGKGGVGKTFVAVNVALTLAFAQQRVGILDADIDCPNVARFLNLRDMPLGGTPEGRIIPLQACGLSVVSTHFLTDDPRKPMIVRGPIKHKVLTEMLSHVDWGELDVLIVDLPPGTADVPMSSMLLGALDGMIIVTTPQKESLLDARKSALMAQDLAVPILGVLENMSGDVFGSGAGEALAKELNVAFLGSIPLSKEIREVSAEGKSALVEVDSLRPIATSITNVVLGKENDIILKRRSFWARITEW